MERERRHLREAYVLQDPSSPGIPAEIASSALHPAAPESTFIVGSELPVDRGMSQR